MIPRTLFGKTGLEVTRIALGGFPFGGVNRARGWDPFTREGRATAVRTVHAALDAGINYIDTAPSYGNGNSESIVGEAVERRRDDCFLATKIGYRDLHAEDVTRSVEASLTRLRTDFIDVIQFHGGAYTPQEVDHILKGGLLDTLEELRGKGRVRFVGFTVEEPWTARPLIASGRFDVIQVRYNLIYQSAAHHVLDEAQRADMGVAVMRPMTSGIFPRLPGYLAPEWQQARDLYEVALKFVLSDSRVHVANPSADGRWAWEVERNVTLAETFRPTFDVARLPRQTRDIYRTDDETARNQ